MVITNNFTVVQTNDIVMDGTARLTINNGGKLQMGNPSNPAPTFTMKSSGNQFIMANASYNSLVPGSGGNMLIEAGLVDWRNASVYISGNYIFKGASDVVMINVCHRAAQNILFEGTGSAGNRSISNNTYHVGGTSGTGNVSFKDNTYFDVTNARLRVGSASGYCEFQNAYINGSVYSIFANENLFTSNLVGNPSLSFYCSDNLTPNLNAFSGSKIVDCPLTIAQDCQPGVLYTVAGTVFFDEDAGIINGTPSSSLCGEQLYVSALDGTNTIAATEAVNPDGTYVLVLLGVGFYEIVLHTNPLGSTTPSLPCDGENTADGFTPTGDGTPNGVVSLVSTNPSSGPVNFGIVTPVSNDPSWTITKTASPTTYSMPGNIISYTITLENTGNVSITSITVSDPLATTGPVYVSGDANSNVTLDVDETWLYSATYSIKQSDIDAGIFTNTVTATGTPAEGTLPPATDSETVNATQTPSLSIEKSIVSGNPCAKVGDEIVYTYTVSNTGNVTLAGPIEVLDNRIASIPSQSGPLAPGSSLVFTATYLVTLADLQAGLVTNTAYARAKYNGLDIESTTDQATAEVDEADMSVNKKVSGGLPDVGDVITYSVEVTNAGPNAATGIEIRDEVPNGLEVDAASITDGGVYEGMSGTITWSGLSVAAGATVTLTYEVEVLPPGVGLSYTNYVEVTKSDQYDPDSTPDNGSENEDDDDRETVVPQVADLYATKVQILPTQALPLPVGYGVSDLEEVIPPVAIAGTKIYYLIEFGNSGPDAAKDVTLTDVFPAQVTNIEYTFNFGNSWLPWSGSFEYPVIGVSTTATAVVFRGDVAEEYTGTITNTVTISSDKTYDPNLLNNEDEAETEVTALADLVLVKTGPATPVDIGGPIEYEIEVTNLGPSTAVDVLIKDIIDADVVSSTSYSTDGVNYTSPWPGSLNVGTLANGGVTKLYIRGTVTDKTPLANVNPIPNTANVTSTTLDPDYSNNEETINTPLLEEADLVIYKTGDATLCAGEQIQYSVTVTNTSNTFAATSVQIIDAFDVSVFEDIEYYDVTTTTWKPWNTSADQYALPTPLEPLSAFTLTLRAKVVSSYDGSTLDNVAEVETAATPDPDLSNNNATWTTDVQQCSDMEIEKTLVTLPELVLAGEEVEYLITYRNNGPSDAQNVVVTDLLPVQILPPYEAALCGTGLFQPWTGSRNLGTVLAGGECVINIRGTVSPDFDGTLTNQACVSTTAIDANQANNCDNISTQVYKPSLQVVKTADKTENVIAGEVVTYTYVVTNIGNTILTNIHVSDNHNGTEPLGPITPAVVSQLAPGENVTFTAQYTVTRDDTRTKAKLYNIATVSGNYEGRTYQDTEDEEVDLEPTYDIGDRVWEDLNGNGSQNMGEPGIPGVEVQLYKSPNEYVSSAITSNSGNFLFQNLRSGNYYFKFMVPAGYQVTFPKRNNDDTIDSDITHANGANTTTTFNLPNNNLNLDGGLYKCVQIGDLVWYDINKNDVWDSNGNGINQLMVRLWRFQSGQWIMWSMTNTGPKPGSPSDDGYFSFCAPPGQYYVEVVMPPQGLVRARPNIGTNEEVDSDITQANGPGTTDAFVLNSGQQKTDIGAGYYPMAIAGNLVWVDENQNGIQEAAEPRMEGVLVEAFHADTHAKIQEAETDGNGVYILDYLEKGNIYMRFTPPAGYGATYPGMTNDALDSDVDHTYGPNTTRSIYFEPGSVNQNIDMGLSFGVLPVEWLRVDVRPKQGGHLVSWLIAREVNVSHYEVERRLNEGSIVVVSPAIGSEGSSGNAEQAYQYRDGNVWEDGIYYCRIKQVDFDGTYTYSDWVRISRQEAEGMQIYPNPASEGIHIMIHAAWQPEHTIDLLDASYKVVRKITPVADAEEGGQEYYMDLTGLPRGMYTVRYQAQGEVVLKKIIKIN